MTATEIDELQAQAKLLYQQMRRPYQEATKRHGLGLLIRAVRQAIRPIEQPRQVVHHECPRCRARVEPRVTGHGGNRQEEYACACGWEIVYHATRGWTYYTPLPYSVAENNAAWQLDHDYTEPWRWRDNQVPYYPAPDFYLAVRLTADVETGLRAYLRWYIQVAKQYMAYLKQLQWTWPAVPSFAKVEELRAWADGVIVANTPPPSPWVVGFPGVTVGE